MRTTWRLGWRAAALALVATAVAGAPPKGDLSVERIFGTDDFESAIPADLAWLPDGAAFLFSQRRDGVDGLWRASVSGGAVTLLVEDATLDETLRKARPAWTSPAMDDPNTHPGVGREPVISPDGSLRVAPARGDLYALELGSGTARFLTDTPGEERFATFSPDGTRLAFARDGDLYVLDLASGKETRLTDRHGVETRLNGVADWVYEEELDVTRSFWWSPDGRAIAYLQYDTAAETVVPIVDDLERVPALQLQRYPLPGGANASVRLGVVASGGGATTWIDLAAPADAYLPRAGWLPSGKGVWAEVLSRSQKRLELKTAVLTGGTARTVITEEDPFWVNVGDDLHFVDDDTFVWASERDGFRHLYLYDLQGTQRVRLTRGSFMVEKVYGVDRARRAVYFLGNAEDPRQRHVYAALLDGSGVLLLTPDPGTHAAVFDPRCGRFLDTVSRLTTPPRLELRSAAGELERVVDDGRIEALSGVDLAAPQMATLQAEDGTTLYTFLLRPPDFDPSRRYPVLVYVYGGPHAQMVTDAWAGRRYLFYQALARRGLVVFMLDNRGSWGRGHAFETPIAGRLGTVELADQLVGVRYLEAQSWVDPSRIGAYGGSYGGFMALTMLTRAPEHFAAGIAYAPVTDWSLYDSIYTERYMGTPAENPEGYREAAPLSHAAAMRGALLECHGAMDNNVHLENTMQMVAKLLAGGKSFELMLYPRVRHGIRVSRYKLPFHLLKADFLERELIGLPRGITAEAGRE